jgi:hypothetical protein
VDAWRCAGPTKLFVLLQAPVLQATPPGFLPNRGFQLRQRKGLQVGHVACISMSSFPQHSEEPPSCRCTAIMQVHIRAADPQVREELESCSTPEDEELPDKDSISPTGESLSMGQCIIHLYSFSHATCRLHWQAELLPSRTAALCGTSARPMSRGSAPAHRVPACPSSSEVRWAFSAVHKALMSTAGQWQQSRQLNQA